MLFCCCGRMASLVHSSALSCSRATAALAPLPSRGDCRALNNGGLRTDLGLCRHKSNLPLLRRTRCDAFGNVRAQAMSVGVETKIASKADVGEVDNRKSSTPCISPEAAAKLCDRNFGVGADGVIFVLPGINGSDYTMRIYNSDGSEPEMCGNGIRCMAKFVAELEGITESRSYKIDTLAGLIVPKLMDDGQICVDMGTPILEAKKIPTTLEPTQDGAVVKAPLVVAGRSWNVTCVSMGNPHCVALLDANEDVYSLPLAEIGPLFEKNEVFPAKTNTEFVQVLSPSHLRMRVWERGAGPTLACGTGACALVVAAVLEGRAERDCLVELPGGPLQIEWRESDNHVYMTGPAEIAFRGTAYL